MCIKLYQECLFQERHGKWIKDKRTVFFIGSLIFYRFNKTSIKENKGLGTSWEQKMKVKKDRGQLLSKIKEITDAKQLKREKLIKLLKERRARKKLNEFKSSSF